LLRIRSASSPRLETPGFWKINRLIDSVADAVQGYFDGDVRSFSFPMVTPGTDFQEDVWSALLRIPYGETRSYAEIATEIGRPAAVRAVGRANGLNALAIVVPCHRVVGANGRLVGYGGGLWRKKRLLELGQASTGGIV
jgi:O-6-methylguanine DNA methyltransferase